MFSHSKESDKDSVPDRYRRSNFPMFPFNLEGNSDRNNVILGSSLTSPYDKDMASLEERKLQKMMHDIGRNKASVNKYRGHVPPLVKVKERSLSPVSRRRQLHDKMRKQVAFKATVEKPGNDSETLKTAEKKRWKEISIGQRKPRDKGPKKTVKAVPCSQNTYNVPQIQGALYKAKPFKLLPPISSGKKHVQDLDEPGKHQRKMKTGFIPVRHTKKSAQVENRLKVKCDAEVTHVRSTAAKIRHALTDIVPGSSDKKRNSSSPVSVWSPRKQSSTSITFTASDWSSTCIASTTPQVIEIHGLSGSLRPVDGGPESVGSNTSSVDDNISQKKAPVERKKSPVTISEKLLKGETPEFGSRITTESVTGDYSCESTRSVSSVSCSEIGRSTRGDAQSPTTRESSQSKSHSCRRSVRGVSKRSRRERRSISKSPSPLRNNAYVKSGYHSSNSSGKENVASGRSRKHSTRVLSRVASRSSTRYNMSTSRSQSPHRAKPAPRLSNPGYIRSEKKVGRKASSHASSSSSSISKITISRCQKSRVLSPCDVKKSTKLIKQCPSRSKSSDVASCTPECRSRSRSLSSREPRLSASLKSFDSGRSGIESKASNRSRKSSLSCCSSKCVSSRSTSGTGLRSPSPCNAMTYAN